MPPVAVVPGAPVRLRLGGGPLTLIVWSTVAWIATGVPAANAGPAVAASAPAPRRAAAMVRARNMRCDLLACGRGPGPLFPGHGPGRYAYDHRCDALRATLRWPLRCDLRHTGSVR